MGPLLTSWTWMSKSLPMLGMLSDTGFSLCDSNGTHIILMVNHSLSTGISGGQKSVKSYRGPKQLWWPLDPSLVTKVLNLSAKQVSVTHNCYCCMATINSPVFLFFFFFSFPAISIPFSFASLVMVKLKRGLSTMSQRIGNLVAPMFLLCFLAGKFPVVTGQLGDGTM